MKIEDVRIFAYLASDIDAPIVWSNCIAQEEHNDLFWIRANKGPLVAVRICYASKNFEDRYSKNPRVTIDGEEKYLVVSEHYRNKLRIEGTTYKTGKYVTLKIWHCPRWMAIFASWGAASACPDAFLRESIRLGWVSLGLGLISLLLSISSCCKGCS